MDDYSKGLLNNLVKDKLGIESKKDNTETNDNFDKDYDASSNVNEKKHRSYDKSYQTYDNHPQFKRSNKKPMGFMDPDEDLAMEQFQKIYDEDYANKIDLYKVIHTVKEAFLEVFNNCVDIYFRQVKHKYGTSGVIFVPQKYIGNKCTIILWPNEGEEPRIKNIHETMAKVRAAENKLKENENKERDNT